MSDSTSKTGTTKTENKSVKNSANTKNTQVQKDEKNLLFNYLVSNRSKLCEYITKHGEYTKIIEQIKDIENRFEVPSIFKKILFDEKDNYGKIFEFPTIELLQIITIIITFFKINKIHDIFSHNGLLANCLDINIKIDQKCCPEITSYFVKLERGVTKQKINQYYKMEEIYIDDLKTRITNSKSEQNMLICSWPTRIQENLLIHYFLENKIVDVMIIIGEYFGGACLSLHDFELIKKYDYHLEIINGKQLCFLDYFKDDKIRKNNDSRSKIMLLHKKTCNNTNIIQSGMSKELFTPNIITKESSNIEKVLSFIKNQNLLSNNTTGLNNDYIIQDLMVNNLIPKFINTISDNSAKTEFKTIYYHVISNPILYGSIPNCINTLDMFKFWKFSTMNGIFPTRIISDIQFLEYYNNVVNAELRGLKYYHDNKNIPVWINTIDSLKKYLYLVNSGCITTTLNEVNQKYHEEVRITKISIDKIGHLYSLDCCSNLSFM